MIVSVTGHRPNKLGGYRTPNPIFNSVMEGLDRALLELQPERVLIGMAQGVDQWMAKLCLFNGIPYVAAIPFEDFDSRWPEHARIEYRQLLSFAERVHVVCGGEYESWKMQRRNEWMVDNSHRLIAVFDGSSGGTANCVRYARDIGRQIYRVPYQAPPPIVNRERPAEVIIRPVSEIRDLPVEQRVVRPQRAPARPETEGQRTALRRVREEMSQEVNREINAVMNALSPVEREELLRAVESMAVRNTSGDPLENHIVVRAEAEPESPKKEEGPVVRDFSRFVDIDM